MVSQPWKREFHNGLAVMSVIHNYDTGQHSHSFMELVIVLGGKSNHFFLKEKRKIKRGDVLLIPPGIEHSYRNPQNLQIINVLFDTVQYADLSMKLADIPGYHALFTVDTELRKRNSGTEGCYLRESTLLQAEEKILRLVEELYNKPPGWNIASQSIFMDFLVFISRNLGKETNYKEIPFMKVVSAVQYMEANLDRKLSLEEISGESGMSCSTLLRAFQKAFDLSPMAYLRNHRLDRAALALEHNNESISIIAGQLGFNDSAHFSRLFSCRFGMSPRLYRNSFNTTNL